MSTVKDRLKQGKDARKVCPRSAHAEPGHIKRDPIPLIKTSSEGRVQSLVALRYGRMLVSPFTFYRGNALLQAHDLAGTPDMGMRSMICGDCHLMNFGGFATPERNLLFSVNDFDEVHPGPWEWDLKRLVASFLVAARDLRHGETVEEDVCRQVVGAYQQSMAECAEQSALEIWYDSISYTDLLQRARSENTLEHVQRAMEKAERRTHAELLPKICERDAQGRLLIRDDLPEIFHLHNTTTLLDAEDDWLRLSDWRPLYDTFMRDYRATLAGDRRNLLARFEVQDMTFKVVGVGSVGTRCLVALMTDNQERPLFLQFKEARASVLAGYIKAKSPRHNGQRVVEGQRLMQSASDLFLGWTTGPSGRHFYVRQLRDMKVSAELENFDDEAFAAYARTCGRALARAHAKASGDAAQISGYIGKSDTLSDALRQYAKTYADQNERDFERFQLACRKGRLLARSEADFAADHLP